MKKTTNILNIILEIILSPFTFLLKSNDQPNPNKIVKPIIMFVVTVLITAAIILFIYRERIFG